jgi:biotin carboxyl carrier protein
VKAKFKCGSAEGNAEITISGQTVSVRTPDGSFSFQFEKTSSVVLLRSENFQSEGWVTPELEGRYTVQLNGRPIDVSFVDERRDGNGIGKLRGTGGRVVSIIPGRVVRIAVQKGDRVEVGDPLVVLEAMKMENEIRATSAGVVSDISVKEGASVENGALLLTLTTGDE